jgi:hypothetical protein
VTLSPVSRARLAATSLGFAAAGFLAALAVSALLTSLKAARLHPELGVDLVGALARTLSPASASDWARLAGLAVVGLMSGAGAAAFLMARHGLRPRG